MMMHEIPSMMCWRGFGLALLIGVLYSYLLFRLSRKGTSLFRVLLISASLIFLVNCVADFLVIAAITKGDVNVFSVLVLSISHSLELFIFQTHFFDNGYQEFFFGKDNVVGNTFFVYVFVITYVLAFITSTSLIIRAISRRRAGQVWLSKHKSQAGKSHIFFLGGEAAVALAEDLRNREGELRIFVGYPDPEENYLDISIWEKIKRLFRQRMDGDQGPFDALVYSRIPLLEASGGTVCRQMHLKDLDAYLKNKSCKVYLLSNDQEANLRCVEILYKDGCQAEIFVAASREGVNCMYEDVLSAMNCHFVDSSYLAVRNILNKPDLLPVQYVDKGLDANNLQEGWVSSTFNAMILGFGETGRECLGFLYEHAAFVGKDFSRSPFSCVVMDREMGNLEQAYRKVFPGMNESVGVTFQKCEIGNNDFWATVEERIMQLNYIVICLGNDRFNLKMAIDLVEFAFRKGKDLSKNFIILLANWSPTHLDELTLKHYNSIAQYHHCIRTFGCNKDVWTYDNLTNESFHKKATKYFANYKRASGEAGDPEALWKKREEEINWKSTDYALSVERARQRSQDYANCFHISTKLALIGPEIYNRRKEIAQDIPASYKTVHYTGSDKHVASVLRYLAVMEHIRWEASHVALGFVPGEKTDDIRKVHMHIKQFDDISPGVQHYDYLVVKTTFESD